MHRIKCEGKENRSIYPILPMNIDNPYREQQEFLNRLFSKSNDSRDTQILEFLNVHCPESFSDSLITLKSHFLALGLFRAYVQSREFPGIVRKYADKEHR